MSLNHPTGGFLGNSWVHSFPLAPASNAGCGSWVVSKENQANLKVGRDKTKLS